MDVRRTTVHVMPFMACMLACSLYGAHGQLRLGKFTGEAGKRYSVTSCDVAVPSEATCAATCLRDDGCTLASHNAESQQCELADTATGSVQDEPGWNMYTKIAHVCPTNWVKFGYSCYHMDYVLRLQQDAQAFCSGLSAHLVDIKTEETYTFLQGYLTSIAVVQDVWSGAKYYPATAQFQWTDRSPFTGWFDPWYTDEPNGLDQGEHCVVMYPVSGYPWGDYDCAGPAYSLCETNY